VIPHPVPAAPIAAGETPPRVGPHATEPSRPGPSEPDVPPSEPPPAPAPLLAPPSAPHPPRAPDLAIPAIGVLAERVRDGAARVLAAADAASDPEALHDMRVALRRLRTVLRACRALLGCKRSAPVLAALRAIARASSALRDEEVLAQTLARIAREPGVPAAVAAPLGRWLELRRRHRERLRRRVTALFAREDDGGLEAALAALAWLLADGPVRRPRLARFASRALALARRDLRAALPVRAADAAGLHRLRIRFKRLRYTAELLAQLHVTARAAAPEDLDALAHLCAALQTDLGAVHDLDQAIACVTRARALAAWPRVRLRAALVRERALVVGAALRRLEALPVAVPGRALDRVLAPTRSRRRRAARGRDATADRSERASGSRRSRGGSSGRAPRSRSA
jgi:CHAD domain-containing protein